MVSPIDIKNIRTEFPILDREIHPGSPIVYLDSAATSQKPRQVIQAITNFYEQSNANVHRGIHRLAEEATDAYESSRDRIAKFISARSRREIIFTRNTTESINLVARSWGKANLQQSDTVLLTEMEHHSNLVPWQQLAEEIGFQLAFVNVLENGQLDLEDYHSLLEREPRLVGFTHMSNMLGTINPAAEMARAAHDVGAIVVVDGAQSVPHFPVNVQELDFDFLAFSAHKMCGPAGIGVLYGREELLEKMPPFLGGGDMIKRVQLTEFTTDGLPAKFEAGTPAIEAGIGFGAAVDFLERVGMQNIQLHERALTAYALERLEEVPGVRVYGPGPDQKGGVMSFSFEGVHPHDVAQILDSVGIAVRAGHHCAMPLHQKFKLPASTRASFYVYTLESEIDRLIEGLYKVKELFD